MRSTRLTIVLAPTRLTVEVASRSGAPAVAHADLSPDAWQATWDEGLRALDEPLAKALRTLGVQPGARAVVLHDGPDAQVEAQAFPTAPASALRAAALAGHESQGDATERLHSIALLAQAPKGAPPLTHVLVASDDPSRADAMRDWLARAGVTLVRAAPLEAAMLAAAVRAAPPHTGPRAGATIYVGEHASALAGFEAGSLRFVRRVSFSTEQLAEALQRPLDARLERQGRGPDDPTATRDAARALLARAGAPSRDAIVDAELNLTGADILPALQPALQRCAIETKQSVRFGLTDGPKGDVELTLLGPGAALPGLARALADLTQLPLAPPPPGAALPPLTASQLAAALPPELSTIGPRTEQDGRLRVARRALHLGAAAACLIITGDAGASWLRLRETRAALAVFEASGSAVADEASLAKSDALQRDLAIAEAEIASAHAWTTNVPAWLAEVSRRTPAAVRITTLATRYEAGRAIAEVEGVATEAPGAPANSGPLKSYLDSLAACPLVEGVHLAAAQRAESEGVNAQRFALRVSLRAAPPPFVRGAPGEGRTGDTP